VLAAAESIVLGDRVVCGANVTITDTDWHGVRPEDRRDAAKSAPVEIGSDVWMGLNALVLKGVRIGRGSVIAAGSVVTRDVPEGVIAAGNPAIVVKDL
jgi:acetyltransferase-like isoleucine patch superfamily enzyme